MSRQTVCRSMVINQSRVRQLIISHRRKSNDSIFHSPLSLFHDGTWCTTKRCLVSSVGGSGRGRGRFGAVVGRGKDFSRKDKGNNFDRKVLQPAFRGELTKKHGSGIPKLAARKKKANLASQRTRNTRFLLRDDDFEDFDDAEWGQEDESLSPLEGRQRMFDKLLRERMSGDEKRGESYSLTDDGLLDSDKVASMDYYAPQLIDDDKYFWREEDYEEHEVNDLEFDDEGKLVVTYSEKDFERVSLDQLFESTNTENVSDSDTDTDDEGEEGASRMNPETKDSWENMDPEEYFFYDQNDIFEIAAMDNDLFDDDSEEDDDEFNQVMPLKGYGTQLDEFLQATQEHPSKYAKIVYENPHPESRREPVPDFPKNRANPPPDFVESFSRFLYVTGLPPLELDGEEGDLNNPVHRSLLEKSIAQIVGKDTTDVFAANTTSGFVGYTSPRELGLALAKGPTNLNLSYNTMFSKHEASDLGQDFFKVSPEATLRLDNIPRGNTPASLARSLFPDGTKVGEVYGNLSPDNFCFLKSSSALVRFESKDQAESALNSQIVRDRLQEFGQCPLRFFRARRELVHDGYGGPNKAHEKRRMGPRLIVDGDMPSKTFFLSHAGVLKMRLVDPSLTKEKISAAFQPYSTLRRDINGSIEFVTCEAGLPTDQVYVGFDIAGDCEAAIERLGGRIKLGDRTAILKLVRDRKIPNRPLARPQRRPDRSRDELLNDLSSWEQYVDPADLEILENAGISRVILDEALRAIRYNNPTFGALDSSLRSEAVRPEKQSGELYKELVQLYVETLKECLVSPANVGELYEAIHFPGEPIDVSIFDTEKERQKRLLKEKARS